MQDFCSPFAPKCETHSIPFPDSVVDFYLSKWLHFFDWMKSPRTPCAKSIHRPWDCAREHNLLEHPSPEPKEHGVFLKHQPQTISVGSIEM